MEVRVSEVLTKVAFSPDSQFIATSGFCPYVAIYSVATGKRMAILHPETRAHVLALDWSPGGKVIATSGTDPTILLWDGDTKQPIGKMPGHTGKVNEVKFAPSTAPAPILASAGEDKVVRIWNPVNGQQIVALQGHEAEIVALAFSPDGTALASGDTQGVIFVWEIRKSRAKR